MNESLKKIPTLEEVRAERVRRNFPAWLPVVSPLLCWDWAHIQHICKALEKVTLGETKKLMIFVPPRHGKSELVTVRYSAWHLERDPSKRIIIGAYNQTLANKFSRKIRRIAETRIPLSDERTAVEDWETALEGGVRAVGVGGGITGQGGDIIVIDDPVKSREEANSQAYRDKVWNWYTDDLYTRLEPGAAMILIMTRWHQDDLAGRILSSDDKDNWEIINLPALAEANDPLGRSEGEPLCPERYDRPALLKIKGVLNSSFEALFQQRPSAMEGAIFKREWWKFYSELPHIYGVVQSWDTAFKTGEGNDYSVCTTWGAGDSGYYLLDFWKGRVEFPELKKQVNILGNKWQPYAVLIEDKASGQSLIQELDRSSRYPILPIEVEKDKEVRAHTATPIIEAGKVYLPESAPWVADYIDSLASFPNGAHDDDVDSTTQALNYLVTNGFAPAEAGYGEERATANMDW